MRTNVSKTDNSTRAVANVRSTDGNNATSVYQATKPMIPEHSLNNKRGLVQRKQVTNNTEVAQRVVPSANQTLDPNLAVNSSADTRAGVDHMGTYVDQDAGAYIGTGMAHTSNLDTCTALAIHSYSTGLSFLTHASALTDPDAIVGYLWSYINQLNQAVAQLNNDVVLETDHPLAHIVSCPEDVEITLFMPPGHGSKSTGIVRRALHKIDSSLEKRAKLIEQANIENQPLYQINKGTRVVVGANPMLPHDQTMTGARVALPTDQLVAAYTNQYIANPTVQSASDLLILINKQDATVLEQTDEEDYSHSIKKGLEFNAADLLSKAHEETEKGINPIHEVLFSAVHKIVLGK